MTQTTCFKLYSPYLIATAKNRSSLASRSVQRTLHIARLVAIAWDLWQRNRYLRV